MNDDLGSLARLVSIKPMQICKNCRFSHHLSGEVMSCRRRSPSESGLDKWPQVTWDEWCGEYEPR